MSIFASDIVTSEISASVSETALDVFVYDTSQDSDGGEWRKRTQNTSWYNETLNTATRGNRREFPSTAVIIATQNNVYIYDGDDPSLPMWMRFDVNRIGYRESYMIWGTHHVVMKNGLLCTGSPTGVGFGNVFTEVNFIDESHVLRTTTGAWFGTKTIAQRNTGEQNRANGSGTNPDTSEGDIVANDIIDLAITAFPTSPIEESTGLPRPTIAMATGGGISILTDQQKSIFITSTKAVNDVHDVAFDREGRVYAGAQSSSSITDIYQFLRIQIPSQKTTTTNTYDDAAEATYYPRDTSGASFQNERPNFNAQYNDGVDENIRFIDTNKDGGIVGNPNGLSLFAEYYSTLQERGMVAFIGSDFNTGWMHGDCEAALLCDITTGNLTNTDLGLITNGDFSNGTTGWSSDQIFTVSGGGVASVQRNAGSTGQCYQTITTEVGRTYTVSVLVSAISNGFQVYKDTSSYQMSQGAVNTTGTHYWTFTATSTSTRLDFSAVQSGTATASFDNITISDGVADRSVNYRGLTVLGTVAKSAVATGAELVSYGPFSNGNHLFTEYSADLNFGTGDFSIMGWFYMTDTSTTGFIVDRASLITSGGGSRFAVYTENNQLKFYNFDNSAADEEATVITGLENQWVHFVCNRKSNGAQEIYINGVMKDNRVGTVRDVSNSVSSRMGVGSRFNQADGNNFTGSLALIRLSKSCPSADQIYKSYIDERAMFARNAACTLYGTSNSITGLCVDDVTETLYAGTSAGRSDFQGLVRINNTTTAVTTAISASNGFVAEQ